MANSPGELIPISQKDLIHNLSRLGVDERTIAASAGLTISETRTILRTTHHLTPEDEELASAMRTLAWTAFEEAMNTLIYGSPADKQSLVRIIISRSMGLVGMAKTTSTDLREEMTKIMAAISESDENLNAESEVDAVAFGFDDSDEGFED